MIRATFLFLSLLSFSPALPAQTAEPQSRTLEAVLAEIRQLRYDLQAAATATRRAQIVIYRLHVQAAIVERATERFENLKNEITQLESQKGYLVDQIREYQELRDRSETELQRKQYESFVTRFKANMEAAVRTEQELQPKQIELEADLRTEQAKWNRLQDELDRLENSLENSALQVSERH